jgi:hypothetical protein
MDENKHFPGEAGDQKSGDKALWDLLGQSREIKASPLFSRNVMREIRRSAPEVSGWQRWREFFRRPVFQLGLAAVAVMGLGLLIFQSPQSSNEPFSGATLEEGSYPDPAHEFESIERLGELMAVSDPGTLSDEALFNLLF